MKRSHTNCSLGLAISMCIVNVGCRQQTVGGDSAIDTERLSGTTLTLVGNDDLQWIFDDERVEITYKDLLIPIPIAEEVLNKEISVTKISASWKLTNNDHELHLKDFEIDGQKLKHETSLRLSPAGPIRANIGSHQFNMRKKSI